MAVNSKVYRLFSAGGGFFFEILCTVCPNGPVCREPRLNSPFTRLHVVRNTYLWTSGLTRATYLITEKNPNKQYYFIMEKSIFKTIITILRKNLKMLILNENSK